MFVQKNLSVANLLISGLPTLERTSFLEHCELVELKLHAVLMESGQPQTHAYFPVDSFVSLILPMAEVPDIQVALVGNEGMFNTSVVLDAPEASLTSLVQGAGRAYRIHRTALHHMLSASVALRDLLNRYLQVRENQLAQQAACMNYHTVEQRLARWLLMTRDRAHSSELFLTHEILATMVGVRRESVTQCASAFQKRGLISYSRGYVMLLDGEGLEFTACDCYRTDQTFYKRSFDLPGPVD